WEVVDLLRADHQPGGGVLRAYYDVARARLYLDGFGQAPDRQSEIDSLRAIRLDNHAAMDHALHTRSFAFHGVLAHDKPRHCITSGDIGPDRSGNARGDIGHGHGSACDRSACGILNETRDRVLESLAVQATGGQQGYGKGRETRLLHGVTSRVTA